MVFLWFSHGFPIKNGGSFHRARSAMSGPTGPGRTSQASKQAMELAEFLSQVVQAPGDGEK